MKKLFILLFVLAFSVSAISPTAYTDAVGFWDFRDGDTLAVTDTLSSTTDSVVLWSNFVPERGWQYALVNNAFTGTGADSVKAGLFFRCKDGNGTVMCTTAVDSYTVATGQFTVLPFDQSPSDRYDIVLEAYTATGSVVIVPSKWWIFRRWPVLYDNKWRP